MKAEIPIFKPRYDTFSISGAILLNLTFDNLFTSVPEE
jgi:hypothetical protein